MCSVQKTLAEHVPAKPPPPPGLCFCGAMEKWHLLMAEGDIRGELDIPERCQV